MRPKTLKLVVTFHTTAAAMAMEALCKAQNLSGRLIPTPRELTASKGAHHAIPQSAVSSRGTGMSRPGRPFVRQSFSIAMAAAVVWKVMTSHSFFSLMLRSRGAR